MRLSGTISAVREMLTPALARLLLFQILSGIFVAPLLTLFPIYVERELGLPPVYSANIRFLSILSGGIMALAGGAVCDTLGRKRSYLLAMTAVISAGLIFLLDRPGPMYPLAFYTGLMFGLGTVAGLTYVMEASPPQTLALATGSYFLTGTIGNALGSAASGWIARELPNGYTILGWTMALGHLALLLVAWRVIPDLPRPEAPRTVAALTGGYAGFLFRREVWGLLGLRFLPTVYWGSATFLMPLLLFRLTGSEKPAGFYTGASLIVSAVCQLAAGRAIDRFGVRVPALLAITMVTLGTLGQGLFARHPAALMGFGLLAAGAAWSLSVTMTTLVQALSHEETRAKLLGLTHVAWSGGFVAGTLVAGYLAGERGIGNASLIFLTGAACCGTGILCAAVVVAALPRAKPDASAAG